MKASQFIKENDWTRHSLRTADKYCLYGACGEYGMPDDNIFIEFGSDIVFECNDEKVRDK